MFRIIGKNQLEELRSSLRVFENMADRFRRERDEARAELAASHNRLIAPLMEANARRKREAAERKGDGN